MPLDIVSIPVIKIKQIMVKNAKLFPNCRSQPNTCFVPICFVTLFRPCQNKLIRWNVIAFVLNITSVWDSSVKVVAPSRIDAIGIVCVCACVRVYVCVCERELYALNKLPYRHFHNFIYVASFVKYGSFKGGCTHFTSLQFINHIGRWDTPDSILLKSISDRYRPDRIPV